jgi:hypothetical protein
MPAALLGLLLAAPVALLNVLAGYLPGAFAWSLAMTFCAAFLDVQLAMWARLDEPSRPRGRHSRNRVRE